MPIRRPEKYVKMFLDIRRMYDKIKLTCKPV